MEMDMTAMEERPFWNPWRVTGWGFALALVLTPLAAMQISQEWNWGPFDFVFAIVVIGGTGVAFELAMRSSRDLAYRAGAALSLLTTFLLVWINAAVGLLEDDGDHGHLMLAGVLLIALGGAALSRLRAAGLARTFLAAALALVAAALVALVLGMKTKGIILCLIFAGLWLASAALFRKAAQAA